MCSSKVFNRVGKVFNKEKNQKKVLVVTRLQGSRLSVREAHAAFLDLFIYLFIALLGQCSGNARA
jgi:hypothetical protein